MWWEGGKDVVGKRNKLEGGGDGGKGVVEIRNKKFRKIKLVKIRCYECKKQMSSKNKQEI